MTAGLWRFVRFVCYTALILTAAAAIALVLPFAFDFCRDGGAGQVACEPWFFEKVFDTGFAIIMFGAYTGVPAALAAGGVLFLLRDLTMLVRS